MAEPLLAKAFAICYTEYWKHIVFCKKGGGSMNEEKDMRTLIEEDLQHSQEIWESYSHDKEKLGELFQLLLQHYDGKIDGFDEDLWVIQDREDCADMAEVYRKNICHLLERLEAFRDNGYSNEGLMEYYIRKEQKDIDYSADFTSVRISLGMADLPAREKEEIMMKLDEMEEICAQVVPRSKKWQSLREYLIWLSGKEADVAMEILPLFFRINDTITKRQEV